MKVTINAAALRTGADLAAKAVPSRPVTPVLACACDELSADIDRLVGETQ